MGETIARSSVPGAATQTSTQRRSPVITIAGFIVILVIIVFVRRWIVHARAELVPVILPPRSVAADVLNPGPGAIARRMALDVRDFISPPRRPRYAVLSFDDGPYPVSTPALLAQLKALNVPANFFFIGRDAIEQPAIAARVAAGGGEVGNHTLSHPQMPSLLFAAQLEEVVDGAGAIKHVIERPVEYFRPPHGNFNATTIEAAWTAGETVALWDVDPGDWKNVTPDFILANVASHARSPAVILLHSGSTATIEALPRIVNVYRRAGFEFVTLSELQRRLTLDQINDPVRVRVVVVPRS